MADFLCQGLSSLTLAIFALLCFPPKGLDSRFGLHRFPSFKNMSFRVTVSRTRCVETSAALAVNTNSMFVTKRKFLSKNIHITCTPEELATHCQLLNFGAEIQH